MQDLIKDNVLEDKYNFYIKESNAKIYLCGSPFMVGAPDLRNGKEIFPISNGIVCLLQSKYGLKSNYKGSKGQINFEKY